MKHYVVWKGRQTGIFASWAECERQVKGFRHAPLRRPEPGGGHVVCGHVHPVVRVPALPGRHPAFLLDPAQTVLPAFSAFTGGSEAASDGHWIACVHGHLLAHEQR